MKDFVVALEQAHFVAFNKFDHELINALETAEITLSKHRKKLTNEQLCKAYLTIAICKTKMDSSDEVLPMLLEVEKLAIAEGDLNILINCLNLQANRMSRTGQLQEAIQKLLNLLEIVQTPEKKISALNNLGVVYTFFGMYDKSLECLFETLRMCEKADDRRSYMHTCTNVGNCYYEQHNYAKSLEYFKAAQKISADYPHDEYLLTLAVNMGLAYANLFDFEPALELMKQAQEMEKTFSYAKNKGSLIYNVGYVYALMGNIDEALKHYNESLELVRTTRNVLLLTTILNSNASIYTTKGEYRIAEKLLLESLQISVENNLPTPKQSCLKQLSFLCRSKGKHKKAFEYLFEYSRMSETAFIDKVKNGIIKYESDYLTEKIEQKAELYRLQYVELAEKNAIISQKQKQLEEALEQLSEANSTKNKLFSVIAHDLRGPVSNLQLTLQAILANAFSQEDQEMMLSLLNEQTKNTVDLLENLLWWAQSQKEGLLLNPEVLLINAVIDKIKLVHLAHAQKKDVSIVVNLDETMTVFADKDALALILRNLIGNAIKYTPPHSTVTITALHKDKTILIYIDDQGSGMDSKIFAAIRKKSQIQSLPGTSSETGMGIGLSLCYEFAHKMKGKITLCKEFKAGTRFSLELPAK